MTGTIPDNEKHRAEAGGFMSINIAIVGLGRVGSRFLDQILEQSGSGIEIVAVAELGDTPGKKKAGEQGIQVTGISEIVGMKERVDILFDLSGSEETRKELREMMASTGNRHTVIAPETVAYLIWSLITKEALPDVHKNKGY